MTSHPIRLAACSALCSALTLSLIACQPQAATAPALPSKPQDKTALKPAAESPSTAANTHIAAVAEWDTPTATVISAPANGSLTQILVEGGQSVRSGQIVAQWQADAAPARAASVQRRVDAAAQAAAKQKWQQDQKLYAQGFISAAALAKSEAAYRAAARGTEIKIPAVSAEKPTDGRLYAPFSGVIAPFAVSAGSKVKNGQQLFRITPERARRLKLLLAEEKRLPLAIGQRVRLSRGEREVWLQISELPPGKPPQYVMAYALWPEDLPAPDLTDWHAEIVVRIPDSTD